MMRKQCNEDELRSRMPVPLETLNNSLGYIFKRERLRKIVAILYHIISWMIENFHDSKMRDDERMPKYI